MEKMVVDVPRMWADHHVLKVREALLALDGVKDVQASSAWKKVMVRFDPDKLGESDIVNALSGAGYTLDEQLSLEGAHLVSGDPAWDELGVRVTETDQRDLAMSGEFRRY
jgi:copper chaperone CopZ